MNTQTHDEIANGVTWRGEIIQTGTQITEKVSRIEADGSLTIIYDAWYDAEVIGEADREAYLKVMTLNIISAQARAEEHGVPIWSVLAGKLAA